MHAPSPRALTWWFGLMVLGGLAFGLFADRRPFGDDVLGHPLTVFFICVGVGLLLLRVVIARPVPELIADRMLLFGCFAGLAAFLVGNWLGSHVLSLR
jgi:hypothetical protein